MKRMLLCNVLVLVLLSTLIVPASAAYPVGTVNSWYSDASNVGYAKVGGSYAVSSQSNDASFTQNFFNSVTYAGAQWNSVLPISIGETSPNYAINYIYGGTLSQMKKIIADISPSAAGITQSYFNNTTDSVMYGNTSKFIYPYTGGKVCIIQVPGTALQHYKSVTLHEMGHMLGWRGHSPTKSDVMYATVQSPPVTTLTDRDKKQLTQIYEIYYH